MGVHWITLETGRRVFVDQLCQCRTYSGLALGVPDKRISDDYFKRSIERVDRWIARPAGPFVIEPPRKQLVMSDGYEAEYLPRTVCVAQLEDPEEHTVGGAGDFSVLTVIWFQEDFAFPIDDGALKAIQAIPWDEHARNGDW